MVDCKVSILMACFNGAKFIKRSFESILSQTWPNIELVFVDDGSTDDSYMVAESYRDAFHARKYDLQIIRQDNQGACAAIVNAANAATGKYLQLLDVDDYIMPESCLLQAKYLENNPQCNVVRTNGYVVEENNLEDTSRLLVGANEPKEERNIFLDLVTGHTNNWAGAYMVRAQRHHEFYSSHELPISRYGQNLQFLLPQTIDSVTGFIDKPLFKYIRHAGSHSYQISYEKQMENHKGYWDIRRKMLRLLDVDDKNILTQCEIAFYRRALNIASDFKRIDEYNYFYCKLKELGGLTLDQKIQKSVLNKSYSQYFYRACLLALSLIRK